MIPIHWLRGGACVLVGATLGWWLATRAPHVEARVQAQEALLRVRLPPSLARDGAAWATLGEATVPAPVEDYLGHPVWVIRGLPPDEAVPVSLQLGSRQWDLGERKAEAPAMTLTGPAGGRRLAFEVRRAVVAWWASNPQKTYGLVPGKHELPGPPAGLGHWVLRWESQGAFGEQSWDAGELLGEWGDAYGR